MRSGDKMPERPENPMKILENLDVEHYKIVERNREFAYADGALPKKFKMLLAMAIDASHGTIQGTMSCAMGAMQAGATKEEVLETLRVVGFISGIGSVYAAVQALKQCLA
jgi:alkylhydroperoxidase/carboxymuconolactone decarboxylase family protein YurZ